MVNNNVEVSEVTYNGEDVSEWIHNGVSVFTSAPVGTTYDFAYKNSIQEFTVEYTATYKLEVWGASGNYGQGSGATGYGAKGGYSCGYKKLRKGDKLYICTGGQGDYGGWHSSGGNHGGYGGYNGGGQGGMGNTSQGYWFGGGGGGATHIATVSGTLKEIGATEFITNGKGLIVAGGGGGGGAQKTSNGTGGGLSGGNETGGYYGTVYGGTQTSASQNASFGAGGQLTGNYGCGGGGGGLYGGGANGYNNGGAGGSGYIAGASDSAKGNLPDTQNGVWSGNGKAKITII